MISTYLRVPDSVFLPPASHTGEHEQTHLPPTSNQQPCIFSICHLEPKFGGFLPRPASAAYIQHFTGTLVVFSDKGSRVVVIVSTKVAEYPCISTGHQTRKKYTGFEVRWACLQALACSHTSWAILGSSLAFIETHHLSEVTCYFKKIPEY